MIYLAPIPAVIFSLTSLVHECQTGKMRRRALNKLPLITDPSAFFFIRRNSQAGGD